MPKTIRKQFKINVSDNTIYDEMLHYLLTNNFNFSYIGTLDPEVDGDDVFFIIHFDEDSNKHNKPVILKRYLKGKKMEFEYKSIKIY